MRVIKDYFRLPAVIRPGASAMVRPLAQNQAPPASESERELPPSGAGSPSSVPARVSEGPPRASGFRLTEKPAAVAPFAVMLALFVFSGATGLVDQLCFS